VEENEEEEVEEETFIFFWIYFRVKISILNRSVPLPTFALPKQKFNFKTFKGVSIIRRGANISLPDRISKVIHG
jgi:hypothetical protein